MNLNPIKTLRNTDQPASRYILRAWLIAFIPSIMIAMVVGLTVQNRELPDFRNSPVVVMLIGILIFSPLVETLMMWGILAIYKKFYANWVFVAFLSAFTWACLHSLAAPTWGISVFWPFFVFSVAFLEWEKKSKLKAICIVTLIHLCQNLIPALILAAGIK